MLNTAGQTGNGIPRASLAVLLQACLQHPRVSVQKLFTGNAPLDAVLQCAGLSDVAPSLHALESFVCEYRTGHGIGQVAASLFLIGPSGAGKSTLLHRWETGEYVDQLDSTDGFQHGS